MSSIVHAKDSDFDTQVIQAEGPVLVDFSAPWCGPCKKLEPLVEEIAAEYDGRLRVVKVNVDDAPQTAARFGVLSVPTLLFMRDGNVRDQVIGLISKQAIADRLEKVL